MPSQLEFQPKESCQVINLRSGKEVGDALLNKKIMTIEDDDEDVVKSKIDDGKKDKKNDDCGKNEKTTQEVPNKGSELKIDLRTLPFPQRFIRRNLDKQFGKFLDHMKDITITIPFIDAIRDMPSGENFEGYCQP